ncbi:hypothetical protein CgunFtcFv8_004697 [Champsocephalus gunnari]|uniref:Uncharacterized protein n=1 Tax=Champsocephalus gunnari TaxID=52237 RepID=A0AAN8I8U7_CHAGU|nr:hypothetical protein CgunFtcFv8_004697 [Champsocephalus gunnari]
MFKELLQEAEQALDIVKAQSDTDFELLYGLMMDNVEFHEEILKFEKYLRAHKTFLQALEEYHAELRSPFTHTTAAMAAAVSSKQRSSGGGGLFFLFTLLGLVCTAASRIDENKLKMFKELLQEAEQALDIVTAQSDTDFELLDGLMMDNVEFHEEILKFEKYLRAHETFFQALEEYHAEL